MLDLLPLRIFTHTLYFYPVTDFLLQSLWFWELVLLCSWGRTLTGCSFVVLLGHSCFTARTGRRTSLGRCALACKYWAGNKVWLSCLIPPCDCSSCHCSSKLLRFVSVCLELVGAVGSPVSTGCCLACPRSGKIALCHTGSLWFDLNINTGEKWGFTSEMLKLCQVVGICLNHLSAGLLKAVH